MGYFTQRKDQYLIIDQFDLSQIGTTGGVTYYDTGTWIDWIRLSNAKYNVDAITYRSAIDTTGTSLIPLVSSSTGTTIGIRLVQSNGTLIKNINTGIPVTGAAYGLSEFETNAYAPPDSKLQIKVSPVKLTSGLFYIRLLFNSDDANPQLTLLID